MKLVAIIRSFVLFFSLIFLLVTGWLIPAAYAQPEKASGGDFFGADVFDELESDDDEGFQPLAFGGYLQANYLMGFGEIYDAGRTPRFQFGRAGLGAAGIYRNDWEYEFAFSISRTGSFILDVTTISYRFSDDSRLGAGKMDVLTGIENLTSSSRILFIERAPQVTALAPPNQGFGLFGYAELEQFLFMFSALSMTDDIFIRGEDRYDVSYKPFSLGARSVWRPFAESANVLHFGLGYNWQQYNDDWRYGGTSASQTLVFTNTQPLLAIPPSNYIRSYMNFHPEFLMIQGPFYVQSEFILQWLKGRGKEAASAKPKGFYIEGSYVFTGGHWEYNSEFGIPSSPYVRPGTSGQAEVALRYGYLNLDAGAQDIQPNNINNDFKRPGIMNEVGLGVNYYASNYVRLASNYFYTVVRADNYDAAGNITALNTQGSTIGVLGQIRF